MCIFEITLNLYFSSLLRLARKKKTEAFLMERKHLLTHSNSVTEVHMTRTKCILIQL
jgi:hypothetical protein